MAQHTQQMVLHGYTHLVKVFGRQVHSLMRLLEQKVKKVRKGKKVLPVQLVLKARLDQPVQLVLKVLLDQLVALDLKVKKAKRVQLLHHILH